MKNNTKLPRATRVEIFDHLITALGEEAYTVSTQVSELMHNGAVQVAMDKSMILIGKLEGLVSIP